MNAEEVAELKELASEEGAGAPQETSEEILEELAEKASEEAAEESADGQEAPADAIKVRSAQSVGGPV